MRSITIGIPEQAAERLDALARRELRRPRDQAAILLIRAIERAERTAARADRERNNTGAAR